MREKSLKTITIRGEAGFDYAYRYPGMNKVLQAAGRVIRTQEDRGILLLLDERFSGNVIIEDFVSGESGQTGNGAGWRMLRGILQRILEDCQKYGGNKRIALLKKTRYTFG